jgi:3-deoxy-manno-octulosonate cytidylyltransferase (CMP-KDO synthetase)
MKTAVIIPARMGSSRFPGKPLAPILGKSMIEHVYRRCSMAAGLQGVYIATCDEEIREATEAFGGQVIMTADTHQRASERTAEAVEKLDVDIVVMVQGDEPLTHPDMIDLAVQPLLDDPEIVCSNLTSKIHSPQEFKDPSTIKVVMDSRGFALYFSREPVPTTGMQGFFDDSKVPLFKQVCIIPFRKEFLLRYVEMEPTPLEIAESIDMLRLLENGYRVKMVESDFDTHAVDTPEDLRLVEQMMGTDPLLKEYA